MNNELKKGGFLLAAPARIRRDIARMAKRQGRSFNDVVVEALAEHFEVELTEDEKPRFQAPTKLTSDENILYLRIPPRLKMKLGYAKIDGGYPSESAVVREILAKKIGWTKYAGAAR